MQTSNHKLQITNRGFTLIEVLVSVTIFSVVMTVSLGALLAMSESNRRAEALKSVINNLNFSLENMSRSIRTGSSYHCGVTGDLATPSTLDCAAGSYFAFRAADGSRVAYCFDTTNPIGVIKRQVVPSGGTLSGTCSSALFIPITSSEVNVTFLQFVVNGAELPLVQPKVTMLLQGTVLLAGAQTTQFNLQTSVTQRIYDQ